MNTLARQPITTETPGFHLSDDPEIADLQKQLVLAQARQENALLRKQLTQAHTALAERDEMDYRALAQSIVAKINELNTAKNAAVGIGPQPLAPGDPLAAKETPNA